MGAHRITSESGDVRVAFVPGQYRQQPCSQYIAFAVRVVAAVAQGAAIQSALSFEERLAMLVDREVASRDDRRRTRLLSLARLKYPQATIEDMDTRAGRGVDRGQITSLALGDWIKTGHTVIINGATGSGKTWLACALGQYACRHGHSVSYLRTPRLAEELRVLHGSGGLWQVADPAGQDRCADSR